jgi:hypothetical protein
MERTHQSVRTGSEVYRRSPEWPEPWEGPHMFTRMGFSATASWTEDEAGNGRRRFVSVEAELPLTYLPPPEVCGNALCWWYRGVP